ncbi:MAG: glycosyltransferase family 4 protein [Verrucomicrobia bacterium]|nr:glycosyltransferase family 4 protein [Verrucomicrobiota bacterium]
MVPAPKGTGAHSLGIECYHVDCRFSDDVNQIGQAGWEKIARLIKFCAEAIWCRVRYGVSTFLYIPAPGMKSPLYRDWMVMLMCRPFFRRRIFYWQAAGLSEWLVSNGRSWERWLSRLLLGGPDLSIVLGEYCRGDAEYFSSRRVAVIPNAIPDPCPDFDQRLRPIREARASRHVELESGDGSQAAGDGDRVFRLLFIGLCTREKGLFDAIDAVALANQELLRRQSGLRFQLNVAGKFWRDEERTEFEERLRRPDLAAPLGQSTEPVVAYRGFVGGEEKRRLFEACDCLCFPTFYPAESFGIVIIEAMAFGMQIVTTRWRTIPELFPPGFPGLVDPRAPSQLADALLACMERLSNSSLRDHFLSRFTRKRYAQNIAAVLLKD